MQIELLSAAPPDETLAGLVDCLLDCVAGGASVGFLSTLTPAEARGWWIDVLSEPDRLTWVALEGGTVLGTVALRLATYPNGRHRGDVVKLLVRRDARGRGVGRALMSVLESEALRRGRWLLVLDTETGSPAEGMYERWGWQRVGTIEDYAASPDGTLAPTTLMTRRLH